MRKNQFNGINDFELVGKDETIVSQLSMGERAWRSDEHLTAGRVACGRRGTVL